MHNENLHTIKTIDIGTPEIITVTTRFPKDVQGMANSVDSDQSDLCLHCLLRPVCPKT